MKNRLIDALQSNNIFLTGSAGVGKSFLVKELIEEFRDKNQTVVVLGSTGVSAVALGGQTLHSFFKFGISNTPQELQRLKVSTSALKEISEILQRCDLLIIDEISMVGAGVLDMVKYRLASSKFGGRILFVGDFFQLPPVFKKESKSLFDEPYYAFESNAWHYFDPKVVLLTKSKRTDDVTFFDTLAKIRSAQIDEEILHYLSGFTKNLHVANEEVTTLFGRNQEATNKNKVMLDKINSALISLPAITTLHVKGFSEQKIDSWKKNLPVPEVVELKIGAKVLFCVNKWGKFANGEMGVVVDVEDEFVKVKKDDKVIHVERHEFILNELSVDGESVEEVKRVSFFQFPLKLAYAITIHKSQGMSIKKLVCDIDNIFEFSQFYVAISRAKEPNNLLITSRSSDLLGRIKRCIKIDTRVMKFYEEQDYFLVEE